MTGHTMLPADDDANSAQPPQHPVPQLQGPFEESMMESLNEMEAEEEHTDSVTRRKLLLERERYERVCAGRWKQRPGEKFHPLWKLSAQLSFGIHLLAQGLAKSEEEVMRILQSHVDDIDGFLERTTEDFDLAQSDVDERLRYLRLPLEHVEVFDHMLDDRAFRTSIVEGNEKIEHIVERTSEAMKDALKDVQKGTDATGALAKYLTELKSTWTDRTAELEAVYVAMLGNVEGWTRAFMDLHLQGNRLAVSLVQLAGIVAEMQRRAGVASRKVLLPYNGTASTAISSAQRSTPTDKRSPRSLELTSPRSPQPGSASGFPHKPLPVAPDLMVPARQASRVKLAHEEKLRRRSLDILRDQEERVKAKQAPSTKKTSMAEKMRSVTKRGSAQALSGKPKSSKPSDVNPFVSAKRSSSARVSPGSGEPGSTARPAEPAAIKERSPQKLPGDHQSDAAVELPAEVPREHSTQDRSKKGGRHIHLGSRHKNKEPGSMLSTSKSLNIFRKSPHPPHPQPLEPKAQSADATATTFPIKAEESPPMDEEAQPAGSHLSPSSVPLPRRQSPDPGLPTPPALVQKTSTDRADSTSYTALPEVLATAQRAKAAKASLRVSVPAITDSEPETTPRAIPSQSPEPVHTQVTLPGSHLDDSQRQRASESESKHTSSQSSLGEPGPEVAAGEIVESLNHKSTNGQDDEMTPTATTGPQVEIPSASSAVSQGVTAESVDTPLTSATMRSYSDFYKLPPQQTPPPATPDELAGSRSIASSVASSRGHSKAASVQGSESETQSETQLETQPEAEPETEPKTQPETQPTQERPDQQPSLSRSSPGRGAPRGKKSMNSKDLRLQPRNKDLQNQSELLDLIASTPPHSPIHTRASSDSSPLNAVGMTSSATRVLAPPEEAPPPPAPGGRSMITPDYAAAGAFEGERKSKRGSGMSTGGWKKMFVGGGGNAPPASTGNGVGLLGIAGSKGEDEEIHMSANLMSGEGNDVLWYKGMGKDGLWVSGA